MFREMRRIDMIMDDENTTTLLKNGQEGILGTLSENGYPYTVVLNYVYHQGKLYAHCAKEGHKIDNINFHEKISFTVYDHVEVIAQKLTTKYQSALVFGRAKVIPATQEILLALIKKYVDVDIEKATKLIENEIMDTAIIEIEIDHLSGKISK